MIVAPRCTGMKMLHMHIHVSQSFWLGYHEVSHNHGMLEAVHFWRPWWTKTNLLQDTRDSPVATNWALVTMAYSWLIWLLPACLTILLTINIILLTTIVPVLVLQDLIWCIILQLGEKTLHFTMKLVDWYEEYRGIWLKCTEYGKEYRILQKHEI